jgi:hypothetical protein
MQPTNSVRVPKVEFSGLVKCERVDLRLVRHKNNLLHPVLYKCACPIDAICELQQDIVRRESVGEVAMPMETEQC